MKTRTGKALLTRGILLLTLALSACEQNPIDAALDEALDFSGFFQAGDGTEIELTGSGAIVSKVGSSALSIPLDVGDKYMMHMYPTDTPGEFQGYVVGKTGLLDRGTVVLAENDLTINRAAGDAIPAQTTFRKIASLPTPPTAGGGTPSTGTTQLLYLKNLKGARGSSTYYKVTVPGGTKKLVVETFEEDQWGHNLGDLFVSQGQQPSVQSREPYRFTAKCSSVNPNREREVCSFDNPAAGEWHILLYGYHEYYGTSLKVTISK